MPSTCFVFGCQKGSKDDERDVFSCYLLLLFHKKAQIYLILKTWTLMYDVILHLHLSY